MTEPTPSRIRLADAIAELRAEISRAQLEGEGKDVRFTAKEIQIELSVDFELTAEGTAGAPKWIPFLNLGFRGESSKTSMHKVTLTLEIDTGGNPSKGRIADSSGPRRLNPTA
jgi:hypothetical protein